MNIEKMLETIPKEVVKYSLMAMQQCLMMSIYFGEQKDITKDKLLTLMKGVCLDIEKDLKKLEEEK